LVPQYPDENNKQDELLSPLSGGHMDRSSLQTSSLLIMAYFLTPLVTDAERLKYLPSLPE
jgi:hypothetical protein